MIVTTTKGDIDAEVLEKRVGNVNDDNEDTDWVEYWLDGELVHRSVHVRLKKPVVTTIKAGDFGG